MSRRVLLICYYFPPLGLGGVGRPLNLFRRLSHHGWNCEVLTVKPVAYRAYEPELLEGLDLSRVHRAGSHDPQRLLYLLGMRRMSEGVIGRGKPVAERFFPDSKVGWVGPAVRLGRRLARTRKYDCLISTAPPISSHLVGGRLARDLNLPWIADFRDFWTIYRPEDIYTGSRLAKAKSLLDRIIEQASEITTVNRSIAQYLKKGQTITNGYDPDLAHYWREKPDDDKLTIGLPGHQHETRQLEPLLRVIRRSIELEPAMAGRIKLLQVGQVDPDWMRAALEKHDLDIEINFRFRQPRDETIRQLSRAHVLYLGISEREGPGFLPGRTFELIASGRPILASVPPGGEVAWLLDPVESAVCFDDESTESAAFALVALFGRYRAGEFEIEPLSDYARRFSAEEIARKFAELMERLV